MELFCKINKEWLFDKDRSLSEEALLVLSTLGLNLSIREDKTPLTYSALEYITFGLDNMNRGTRNIITCGISDLLRYNIISVVANLKGNTFVCDVSKILHNSSKNFIKITKTEFDAIMNVKEDVNKVKLLRYYMCLLGLFQDDQNPQFAFKFVRINQTLLSTSVSVSTASLVKYNEILAANKLIYIVKTRAKVEHGSRSNLYKQLPSIYTRYADKDLCGEYLSSKRVGIKSDQAIKKSDEMRSLAQKYNYFKRTYAEKECKDINNVRAVYEAAKLWNDYAREDYEAKIQNGETPNEPKYKDLSIFDSYNLN